MSSEFYGMSFIDSMRFRAITTTLLIDILIYKYNYYSFDYLADKMSCSK